MKSDASATGYIKRATLSAICFYIFMVLFAFSQGHLGSNAFISEFVDMLKLALFAFLIFVYPAYCAYKIADLKDSDLSKKWRFLQLSHIVCCMPLWFAFFSANANVPAKTGESVETVATRLFVILVIVSLSPLIGFIIERFIKNQRWNRL